MKLVFKLQIGEIKYDSKEYMSILSAEITDIKLVLPEKDREKILNLSSGIKLEIHLLGFLMSSFYKGFLDVNTSYFSLVLEKLATETITTFLKRF